jgi:hypothetical protein
LRLSRADSLGLLTEKHAPAKSTNGVVGKIGKNIPTVPRRSAMHPIIKNIIFFKFIGSLLPF